VEDYVVGLDPHPYGRRIIARFPAMIRKLAAYTRSGVEEEQAVLRCYLPAVAAHNLLLGAELALVEATRAGGSKDVESLSNSTVAEATAPSNVAGGWNEANVDARMRQNVSLAFPRDTLEAALQQLSREVGVTIVIDGASLQAEGITKNQSFGIDMANRPAEQILAEILRLANPDQSVSGPGDARQKLVYVVAREPGKPQQIVVTTRAGAAARGDTLPAVFRANSP
jgi:hypothetical protein